VGVAALLLVAACGTTVSTSRTDAVAPAGGSASDGLGAPPAAAGVQPGTAGASVPGATDAAAPTLSGGGVSAVDRPAGTADAAGRPTDVHPSTGTQGVTATSVSLGFVYTRNSGTLNSAAGAGGIDSGDEKQRQEALVKHVNTHGGFLGRKVVPVYEALDQTSQNSYTTQLQAICTSFTQDQRVFAVVSGTATDAFAACLTKAGVALISDGLSGSGAAMFRKYPLYAEASTINLDRMAAAEAAALSDQQYFSGWNFATGEPGATTARIGVVTYTTPAFAAAVQRVLVPALKARGQDVVDVIQVKEPNAASDISEEAADISAAVLKLRSDNISHVILFENGGNVALFFLRQADSQKYMPRYGFNSQNAIQVLLSTGNVPESQVHGAKGLGWWPILDIENNPPNGPFSNPARRACLAVMKEGGATVGSADAEQSTLALCAMFSLLQRAVERAGIPPSGQAFAQGLSTLGRSFESPMTFSTSFSPTKHDGAAVYRHWSFEPKCGCFAYSGPNRPVPE
jgi:hypothetical protein